MGFENRRKAKRASVTRLDAVATRDGIVTSTLRVLDVSNDGARLEVTAGTVPDDFILRMSRRGGTRRQCRVVWRNAGMVGVRFDR